MKKVIFILAVLFVCSSALANNSPVKCYKAVNTDLGSSDATLLCSGATSMYPSKCYYSVNTDLGSSDATLLCSGATSMYPSKCYHAVNTSLGSSNSACLCTKNWRQWLMCAPNRRY